MENRDGRHRVVSLRYPAAHEAKVSADTARCEAADAIETYAAGLLCLGVHTEDAISQAEKLRDQAASRNGAKKICELVDKAVEPAVSRKK
jgi:hypothetical protein